ncbi:MAG: DUF2933 domain-containing protein [Microgenomates group bacterium]|jgi:hypothetical protein
MNCCKNISKSKIFIFCLLGISAVLIAIYFFKVPVSSLFTFGFLLLCPLMHIFMMKGHSMKSEHESSQENKKEELKD